MTIENIQKSRGENPCNKMTYVKGTGWVCEDCFIAPCSVLDKTPREVMVEIKKSKTKT